MQTIGERIATARASLGWSQKRLSEELGCKPEQVSMWEAGRRNPRPKAIATLAKALGTRYEWLILGQGSMRESMVAEVSAPYRTNADLSPAKRIILRALEADLARMTDEQAEAWYVNHQKAMDKTK